MYLKKAKIIQLFCILVLVSCQRNDIEVFNGPNTNINDLNGNWVLINYWADWCAPCIKEIPELNDFAAENKNIKVYTFNFDELEIDDLKPSAKKFNIKVPSLVTHPRDIWGIATPPAVPATYFINPNGEIAVSLFRPQTKDSLNTIYIELKNTI